MTIIYIKIIQPAAAAALRAIHPQTVWHQNTAKAFPAIAFFGFRKALWFSTPGKNRLKKQKAKP